MTDVATKILFDQPWTLIQCRQDVMRITTGDLFGMMSHFLPTTRHLAHWQVSERAADAFMTAHRSIEDWLGTHEVDGELAVMLKKAPVWICDGPQLGDRADVVLVDPSIRESTLLDLGNGQLWSNCVVLR